MNYSRIHVSVFKGCVKDSLTCQGSRKFMKDIVVAIF